MEIEVGAWAGIFGFGFRPYGSVSRGLLSGSAFRVHEFFLPTGSIYTTIMELGTKRPLWSFGP